MKRTRLIATAIAVLVLSAGVTACGGDDEESTTTAAEEETATESVEEVTLTADDISPTEKTFELSAMPTAETKSVTFVNEGDESHALLFARINEGFTLEEAFELQGEKGSAELIVEGDAKPGQTRTFDVKKPIEPGNYAMLCPIPNKEGTPHFELGQLEEFDIS